MVKEQVIPGLAKQETEKVTPRPSEFHLIDEAEPFFDELQQSIRNAKSTIQFQSFLFGRKHFFWNTSSQGDRIVTELQAAAQRGVKVEVMTDGMFPWPARWWVTKRAIHDLKSTQRKLAKEDKDKPKEEKRNIEFRFPFEKFVVSPNPLKMAGTIFNRLAERDHTKNIIIDADDPKNGVAYIGGRNAWSKDPANADFMVRIKGEMVGLAAKAFEESWEGKAEAQVWSDAKGNEIVRDGRNTDVIFDKLIDNMKGAKQRIWLQTPYFDRVHLSPYLIALRKLLPSQVNMRFVTPFPISNNHTNYRISSPFYMQELSEEGIQVKAYKENVNLSGFGRIKKIFPWLRYVFSHAKGLLVDGAVNPQTGERESGVAVIGSSNFSKRKILGGRNAEVNLFIHEPEFLAQLETWYEKCFATSIDYGREKPTGLRRVSRRLYRFGRLPKNTPSVEDAFSQLTTNHG